MLKLQRGEDRRYPPAEDPHAAEFAREDAEEMEQTKPPLRDSCDGCRGLDSDYLCGDCHHWRRYESATEHAIAAAEHRKDCEENR